MVHVFRRFAHPPSFALQISADCSPISTLEIPSLPRIPHIPRLTICDVIRFKCLVQFFAKCLVLVAIPPFAKIYFRFVRAAAA
jgi:hypothetical protein